MSEITLEEVKTYCEPRGLSIVGNELLYELQKYSGQKWIPCSERLPKPYEHCLWTTTEGKVVYHHCDGLFSNYIAWMPLPEPYKPE